MEGNNSGGTTAGFVLQTTALPDIPIGWKFAAVGLQTGPIPDDLPECVQCAPDLWICRKLPAIVLAHWEKWLGAIRTGIIEDANLWILSMASSVQPEVSDDVTVALEKRAYEFYYALIFAIDNFSYTTAIRLSGANIRDGARITGAQDYPTMFRMPYSPIHPITIGSLITVATIADVFQFIKRKDEFKRVWRVLRAFYSAGLTKEIGERIHQHVRSVEGFIFPTRGKTKEDFTIRTQLFTGKNYTSELKEIFDIRSAVEHLHGPFRFLPAIPEKDRHTRLVRRAIEMEAIARHAIRQFFKGGASLWNYYKDDQTLEQFWTKVSLEKKQKLWGAPLNLLDAMKDFREDWLAESGILGHR